MNVVISGSLGYDYIMDFPGKFADRIMPDKIHKISLSFLVDGFSKNQGGTAGNISYSLSLLGITPSLFAAAGNDFAPYKSFLENHGVDTNYVHEYVDMPTGCYFVITDKEDNQIGAFYTGAMKYASELSIQKCHAELVSASRNRKIPKQVRDDKMIDFVVIAPNHPKAMVKQVMECQKLHIPYMYDPAFQIATFSKEELARAIKQAQILISNDYEISLIEKKLQLSHSKLLELVPIVVTTLGSKGSMIEYTHDVMLNLFQHPLKRGEIPKQVRDDRIKRITIKPAKPKNTSDPTGAGDAYRAGFLAGYLRKFNLQTCGQMGATAAVYTVEKYGTQTHTFTIKEFCKRYKENFGERLILDKLE